MEDRIPSLMNSLLVLEDYEFDYIEEADSSQRYAWYFYESTVAPYFLTTGLLFPLLLEQQAKIAAGCIIDGKVVETSEKCMTSFLGVPVSTTSVALLYGLCAIIIQLVVYVLFAKVADHGEMRKQLLLLTHVTSCVLLFIAYLFSHENYANVYPILGWLGVLSLVCMGYAQVCYNSYLPHLVAYHQSVVDLEPHDPTLDCKARALANEISSRGYACGMAVSGLTLLFTLCFTHPIPPLMLFAFFNGMAGAGIVQMYFGVPAAQEDVNKGSFKDTYGSMLQTFSSLRASLPQLGLFLIAFYLYVDGATTIARAAPLFGRVEVDLGDREICGAYLILLVAAIISSLAVQRIQAQRNIPIRVILLACIGLQGLLPLWAMVGVPKGAKYEFFALAFVYGAALGPQSVYQRVIFASYIPKGREAEFFGLFAFADKGASWLGPLMLIVVERITNDFRAAFSAVSIFCGLGLTALYFFDETKAKEQKEEVDTKHALALQPGLRSPARSREDVGTYA